MPSPLPTIVLTTGDPLGIGPEVTVKALADPRVRALAKFRILGLASTLDEAAHAAGIEPFWWRAPYDSLSPGGSHTPLLEAAAQQNVVVFDDAASLHGLSLPHHPHPPHHRNHHKSTGEMSFRWVNDAVTLAQLPADDPRHADAIVTGPISKEAWAMAGHAKYPGHTELLLARCRSKRVGMMFAVEAIAGQPSDRPALCVILATAHVPLMTLTELLTIGRVFDAIELGHRACLAMGIEKPRVAVCGLNPHAGENGLLGEEDQRIIAPAITIAQRQGILATGPHPGDTIFGAAVAGKYDLVVAMYHDQGLIPVKLLARDRTVNVTVGLPIIRTSPDHGTAFDIAGKNQAEAGSTVAAIRLALRLVAARARSAGGGERE